MLKQFPERSESHLIAGHLEKIQGDFARAASAYRRSLELDPHQTEAFFNLVDLSPPEPSDPLVARLETLWSNPDLAPHQLANVQFALARACEHAQQFDRSFALFRQANATAAAIMQAAGNGYDPRRHDNEASRILGIFGPQALYQPLEPLEIDLKMIFIVGLPRSGTTLVERILSSHSRVASAGELPFMQDCLAQLLAVHKSGSGMGTAELAGRAGRQLLGQLREHYLDALFERELDADYVIDKLPANFTAVGLIRALFPDAAIVHCARDPLATCWSLYTANFGAHVSYNTSLDHLLHYYRLYSRFIDHWRRLPGTGLVTVHYEQLVADPEVRSRELLAACGLPWEAACLSFDVNDQPIYTANMQQARRPIYTTSVDRWRKFQEYLAPLIEGLRGAG